MTIKTKSKSASLGDLIQAIRKFAPLLLDEGDLDANEALKALLEDIEGRDPEDIAAEDLIEEIDEIFEEYELFAYTMHQPKENEWSKADELFLGSTQVLNLAKRLRG